MTPPKSNRSPTGEPYPFYAARRILIAVLTAIAILLLTFILFRVLAPQTPP